MTLIKKNYQNILIVLLAVGLVASFLYTKQVNDKFTALKQSTEERITKITEATENYGKKLDEALEANSKVNKSLDELIASLKTKYVDNNGGQ